MAEINASTPSELVEAVQLFAGWGRSGVPDRDEGRVTARFGTERGRVLLEQIRVLEDDFYRSDAHLVARSPSDMASKSAADFRASHPQAAREIIDVFVWCYTYDYK